MRRDLEFAQKQLQELRSAQSSSSPYGSSYGSASAGPTPAARDAHRARGALAGCGKARSARARPQAAARELEETRRAARDAADRADERVRAAESREDAERGAGDKDRELRVAREAPTAT